MKNTVLINRFTGINRLTSFNCPLIHMHFIFKLFWLVCSLNLENIETENIATMNAHNQEARCLHISCYFLISILCNIQICILLFSTTKRNIFFPQLLVYVNGCIFIYTNTYWTVSFPINKAIKMYKNIFIYFDYFLRRAFHRGQSFLVQLSPNPKVF